MMPNNTHISVLDYRKSRLPEEQAAMKHRWERKRARLIAKDRAAALKRRHKKRVIYRRILRRQLIARIRQAAKVTLSKFDKRVLCPTK